jgi:hypothetical protein
MVVHLSVVEPIVVDPRDDLLAHFAHVTQKLRLRLVGGRAQAELGAVDGSIQQLLGDAGHDGGSLLSYGGVAKSLQQ